MLNCTCQKSMMRCNRFPYKKMDAIISFLILLYSYITRVFLKIELYIFHLYHLFSYSILKGNKNLGKPTLCPDTMLETDTKFMVILGILKSFKGAEYVAKCYKP